MKRVLLSIYVGLSIDLEVAETYLQYKNDQELLSKIRNYPKAYMYIDTDKNLFCANVSYKGEQIFHLEDIDLINNTEFTRLFWRFLFHSAQIDILEKSNFDLEDLTDYFSHITTNEKTRDLIFRVILKETNDDNVRIAKILMNLLLKAIFDVDPVLFKKYHMELKLANGVF